MKRILIVCTTNKVRSVMAKEVASFTAAEKHADIEFECCGIAVVGSEIDDNVRTVLRNHGLDTNHIPVNIASLDLNRYDEIHVMTERHKKTLISLYGNLEDTITVLHIDDPYMKGEDAYEKCYSLFKDFYGEYIK